MTRENRISMRQQPAQEMPLVPRFEFFQTLAGPGETAYPDSGDDPTVYYGRQLKNVTFTETPGAQSISYDTTDHYGCIYNLSTGDYIEESSVLLCQRKNGRWWTVDKVKDRTVAAVLGSTVYGLSAATGATRWTYDLTELDENGYVYGGQVRFDGSGRLWGMALAWDDSGTDTTPSVMVYRLSPTGSLQWSTDLGAINGSSGPPPFGVNTTHSAALTLQLGTVPMMAHGDVQHLADGRVCVSHMRLSNDGEILSFFDSDGTLDEQMGAGNTTVSVSPSYTITNRLASTYWMGFGGLAQDANGALWLADPQGLSSGNRLYAIDLSADWFSIGQYTADANTHNFTGVQKTAGVAAHPTSEYVYTAQITSGGTLTGDDAAEVERTLQLSDITGQALDLTDHHTIEDVATAKSSSPATTSQTSFAYQVAYHDNLLAVATNGFLLTDTTQKICREIAVAGSMTASAAIIDDTGDVNSGDIVRATRCCFEPVTGSAGGIFWGRHIQRASGTTASLPMVQRSNRAGTIEWSALSTAAAPQATVTGLDCF